ncbi:hypothetical protein EG329_001232 [Mollisiaceae sp. DMI_Dod_QoI]|nr:hypothetical protein EG329_001232 [Helotiales sp. DMI_Dod_QoI]
MTDITSQGQNQFLNTPSVFSFSYTQQFSISNAGQTWLTGLFVDGITDTSETLQLPLWGTQCANHSTISTDSPCTAWIANGSALTFGGPYADGLVLLNQYRFRLTYVAIGNASETGKQQSSEWAMVGNPTSASNTNATVTSTNASSTGTGTSTPTTSPTTPSAASSSLSVGAKAGIGVGAAIGALLILLGVFFIWRQPRRRRVQTAYSDVMAENKTKNEIPNQNLYERGELDGTLPTTLLAQEMDATVYRKGASSV